MNDRDVYVFLFGVLAGAFYGALAVTWWPW